jgi:hypothetical protein
MQIADIFLRLGEQRFEELMRSISMGRLRTFQLFDALKTRVHLHKLNSETLRKAAPRLWTRLAEENSGDLAGDLAQAILVSHLDLIKAVLDDLGVPHEEGFFAKDADVSGYLKDGWQPRVWEKFRGAFPPARLLFIFNHLAWEVAKAEDVLYQAVGREGAPCRNF